MLNSYERLQKFLELGVSSDLILEEIFRYFGEYDLQDFLNDFVNMHDIEEEEE